MANYFVISRAKPKPGYAATGLKHLKTLADFTKENGAVHCDVGVQQTGANAGSLIAAKFVEKMATIENIFDHNKELNNLEILFTKIEDDN